MMQSHRRAFLSLRRKLLSDLRFNPPVSRSSVSRLHLANPNSPSFSFSFSTSAFRRDHRRIGLRSLICCNSPPLTRIWSFGSDFNGLRGFATRLGESSNGPPKETIMLAGCDWEHWLVVVEAPDPYLTRDEIIDGYIKTLAHVVGSEEEARMKIYSVSTRHYYAFGALLPEEVAYKLKDQPHVRWVLPDSYLDVKNKTYAGEPFINGQAVPYDPKYHEIWLRNHEASLNNNLKNKRRQRDLNSSRPRSRSPTAVSSPSSLYENLMPSAGSENQAPQMSNVQSQKSGHSSLSIPSVTRQNGMPSAPPTNQTLQTSQVQNPAPPASSQSHAPQYSQMQNQSSPWTRPSHESSARMNPNQLNLRNQNQNWTPVVGSQNQATHPSQVQNPAPQPFSESPAPQYSQMQNHSSPWTPPLYERSATMDPNHQSWSKRNQDWTPVSGSQNQAVHTSQMQNPSPPPPSPTMNPTYQSWGKRNQNWMPYPGSHNEAGHESQPAFSESHAPEYSQMQNYSSPRSPLPSEPSATMEQNSRSWSNQSHNWTADVGSQNKAGHPSQLQNTTSLGFSRGKVFQYSQTQNHSLSWTSPPPTEPSASGNPNQQSWSNQDWKWTRSENQTRHPSQWQNQTHPPSPNQYTSAWNNANQSWEPAPGYQSQSAQPPLSNHNFSYDNMPPPPPLRAMPSHTQSPDIHRGGIQFQVQQNGYPYTETSCNAQIGSPQNGYPSHASQHQQFQNTFQKRQSPNAMPSPQGWNHHNMTPPMQSNGFPNTNMPPQECNHRFQSADMARSMQNENFSDQQVDNYDRQARPSYTNMTSRQTREYKGQDMPMDEEYMQGSR